MSIADFGKLPADKDALVSVERVSKVIKHHAGETIILNDVSFRVPVGRLFAVNGPSGSGKSTLLNMLTGIDRPSSGQVLFEGEALRVKSEDELARWRGQHVGIVFQFFQLIPALIALENVILALELGGAQRLKRRAFRERAMRCLEQAHVEMLAHRLPSELSGGEQQRVAIARALANDPPLIVADEPTGNLDSRMARLVFETLADLVRAPGRTLVIILSILIAVFLFTAVNSSETIPINAFAAPGYGLQESGYDHYATLLRVIALVGVVLASVLILSTVTALMTEQVQIIGLLKALGGTRLVIVTGYLISIGIAAIIGTLSGIGLGVPIGYAVAVIVARNMVIRDLPPSVVGPVMVTPGVIALSLLIGLGIPCGAALFPLWQATRITVREEMSTYGLTSVDERVGRTLSRERARHSRSLNRVPQLLRFGLNSIVRRRGRAALAILSLSCAGALFLAVTTPIYALYQQVRDYYAAYHFDVRVYLHQPERFSQLQHQLLAIPNVQYIERGSRQQVSTSWGILDLQEVEASTHVYHPQLVTGHWFLPNEKDVLLLNETAANIMHRTVGETLTFTDKTVRPGHTATWKIIGIVHDDSVARGGLGVAITTPEYFHRFYGLAPDEVDGGIFVQSRQHAPLLSACLLLNSCGR